MVFNRSIRPTFILRVLSDPKKHWSENRVSFAYLSNRDEEAIINFHHNDVAICSTNDDPRLIDISYSFPEIVAPAASQRECEASASTIRNAEMVYWFNTGNRLEIDHDFTIRQYHSMGVENVNDYIPIMRWIDWCRQVRDRVDGLSTDCPALDVYESFVMNLRSIEKKCKYGHYNPYTLTGRPSNTFGGINYAALTSEQRYDYSTRFVNGFLIDIDLSSFHLHLLYSILGLEIPDDIYKSLSILYPPNVDPKAYTFRQIYGGIDENLMSMSPFKEIGQLADNLFDAHKSGNLTTLLHGRKFVLSAGLNRWKILNYCLQSLETEHNMDLIDRCLKSELNLVLYTYDSFLFDVDVSDVGRAVEVIKKIFSDLKYKVKVGRNYGNMKLVTI